MSIAIPPQHRHPTHCSLPSAHLQIELDLALFPLDTLFPPPLFHPASLTRTSSGTSAEETVDTGNQRTLHSTEGARIERVRTNSLLFPLCFDSLVPVGCARRLVYARARSHPPPRAAHPNRHAAAPSTRLHTCTVERSPIRSAAMWLTAAPHPHPPPHRLCGPVWLPPRDSPHSLQICQYKRT